MRAARAPRMRPHTEGTRAAHPHGAKPAAGASGEADAASPRPAAPTGDATFDAMRALLKTEAAIRSAETVAELQHVIVNEVRKAARAHQVFALVRRAVRPGYEISVVSSVPVPDSTSPLVHALQQALSGLAREAASEAPLTVTLHELAERLPKSSRPVLMAYPMRALLWLPLTDRAGRVFAGLLLAREAAWNDTDTIIAKRLAATGAHAWLALKPKAAIRRAGRWRRWLWTGVGLAALVAMFIPVPMSALAPFEIVPRDPFVIAAPMDGVVEDVAAAPNTPVTTGELLVAFTTTELRSRFELADRELRVAEAKLKRASQMAFEGPDGRRELAVARAERDVRAAERAHAREMLERALVRAPSGGVAVFNDVKDLIGRPVKVGERLMELADPGRVQARLEMPVADGALLVDGAHVTLYLDSDPLTPRSARLVRADYQAQEQTGQRVAFRAIARLDETDGGQTPRLGIRGTAQVYGDDVPLGLLLFRRPLAKARQWLGL